MRLKRLIAWTIYEERQKRGLSQERLGKMAGCHRTTVAKIEAEELQSMDLVEAILDALDVNEFAQLVKDKSPVRATKQAPVDKLPKEEPKPRQNGSRSLRGASETPKGKWIEYPAADGMNQCSECGVLRFGESNYCPNCGADMREDDLDG